MLYSALQKSHSSYNFLEKINASKWEGYLIRSSLAHSATFVVHIKKISRWEDGSRSWRLWLTTKTTFAGLFYLMWRYHSHFVKQPAVHSPVGISGGIKQVWSNSSRLSWGQVEDESWKYPHGARGLLPLLFLQKAACVYITQYILTDDDAMTPVSCGIAKEIQWHTT